MPVWSSMHEPLPKISDNELYARYMALNPIGSLEMSFVRLENLALHECRRGFKSHEWRKRLFEEQRRYQFEVNAGSPFSGFKPIDLPPPHRLELTYGMAFITRWLWERCRIDTMMPFISLTYYALWRRNDRLYDGDRPREWQEGKARLIRKLFAEEHFHEWISHFVNHIIVGNDEDNENDTSALPRYGGVGFDLWLALYPTLRFKDEPNDISLGIIQFIVTDFVLCCLRLEAEPVRWEWHWYADRESLYGTKWRWRTCTRPEIRKLIPHPNGYALDSFEVASGPQGLYLPPEDSGITEEEFDYV
ncbi:hypothetical protein FKW77_005872 [Venturia effusa]|uniref:Uncharacterized protein n=1 Tax=Venturia effusa TaxID=50376 RepID=A0A517LQ93_9PEZI|nr:hypothetical protein FKW77_005872 [Venturia effusa]